MQTPAPRRFAPPAGSSSARNTAFSGASARFARPSQPTSSPFTRTPFSSARKDEIEIDDEDEDDLEEQISTAPLRQLTPARSSHRPKVSGDDPSLRDTVFKGPSEGEHRQSDLNTGSASSTKGSKRRKISHFHHGDTEGPSDVLDSSPPDSSPTKDPESAAKRPENETSRSAESSPADHIASEIADEVPVTDRHSSPVHTDEDSPGKEFETPKMRTSRFRNPLTQSSQANSIRHPASTTAEQPLPSFQSRLLAASTASSPGSHLRGPHPSLDFVLPDAFSPSRRRGQLEYVEHGYAETVRNWVLDMAARSGVSDTLHTTKQRVSDEADPNSFSITRIIHLDRDDRFAIVSITDQAELFMLVDTDPKPPPQATTGITPKSRLERLHEGSQFVFKGGQVSSWMMNITNGSLGTRSETDMTNSTDCRVVVLWDLIH